MTCVLVRMIATLVAEVIVAVALGAIMSWMVTRGWLDYEQMEKGSGIALLVAGMAGGVMLCRGWKRTPLLWGVVAGVLLTALCLVCGVIMAGTEFVVSVRVFLPVVGGVAAGVLTALKR